MKMLKCCLQTISSLVRFLGNETSNYKNIPYYTCSAYTKVLCGTLCPSAHRIKAEVVLKLIQRTLQDIKKSLDEDNEAFLRSIQNEMEESEQRELSKENDGLEKAIKRYEKEQAKRI